MGQMDVGAVAETVGVETPATMASAFFTHVPARNAAQTGVGELAETVGAERRAREAPVCSTRVTTRNAGLMDVGEHVGLVRRLRLAFLPHVSRSQRTSISC